MYSFPGDEIKHNIMQMLLDTEPGGQMFYNRDLGNGVK